MPGLGKTTLANKVYTASSVRSYFHVCGWCCVSQTYSKHSMFVQLLCSIHSKSPDKYLKMDENDLVQKLKQVLLRTRYLLILDDLWDVEAWNLLENSLLNDVNGIVLVAGILATTAKDSWKEVAKSLSSIVLEDEYCMKALKLSYSHLPDYLKPCLLYFAAFKEDEAEGKSLEEAAYDYLMALVNRSLVMVIGQRIVGGAKAYLLHDLVHEFCVEKAKEESFLYVIHRWKAPLSLTGPSNPHRVCVSNTGELTIWELMLIFPNLCSLILFGQDDIEHEEEDLGILLPKLLRVLDFRNLGFDYSFPMEVVLLVHLRGLALKK
ncbi:putative late blight resistance protein homolog R1B-16 [Coffea arabica]|uniref:Late blight resistance protein homolog R1B-16 n=1 Tax=Coffea arabica TaxID=13443 RepID=A0ABM4V9Q5_COFAR